MLKIADSAAIRHNIPTRPRNSWESGSSGCVGGKAGAVETGKRVAPLFVLPVRIFGMFQVPQRTAAADDGSLGEVVFGGRRRRRPFERPPVPRIGAGRPAVEERRNKINHPGKNPGS